MAVMYALLSGMNIRVRWLAGQLCEKRVTNRLVWCPCALALGGVVFTPLKLGWSERALVWPNFQLINC